MHREDVLLAAEALVDRDGANALTMSALAHDLGLRTPSLYNHVDSLEALRGDIQNRAMQEIGSRLRHTAMGKVGEPGLRALAHSLRRFAAAHPGRYDLAMREPYDRDAFTAASHDAIAALAAIISSFGIHELAVEAQLTAFAAVHGFISLEASGLITDRFDSERIFELIIDMLVDQVKGLAVPDVQAV
jgi:AcrR family transcriptional regulator